MDYTESMRLLLRYTSEILSVFKQYSVGYLYTPNRTCMYLLPRKTRSLQAFTLIEILVVIGLIAILASIVLIAINPLRQFAQARNAQRVANVNAIINAVGARTAERQGIFTDATDCSTPIPEIATTIDSEGGYDLRKCVVPTYIPELPFDPNDGSNTCESVACNQSSTEKYTTGYTIKRDTIGRVTICAPGREDTGPNSPVICLTR